jgi:hypothetical protein
VVGVSGFSSVAMNREENIEEQEEEEEEEIDKGVWSWDWRLFLERQNGLWRDGSYVWYWGFERRFNVIAGLHSC